MGYPPAVNPRLAYDIDGTKVILVNVSAGNTIYELSSLEKSRINDETSNLNAFSNTGIQYLVFVFPETTTVTDYYWAFNGGNGGPSPQEMAYSNDSTNGLDGTWTNIETNFTNNNTSVVSPGYRTVHSVASPVAAKFIRFRYWQDWYGPTNTSANVWSVHLYGTRTVSFLEFWHPTLDQQVSASYFDFGDVGQGTGNTLEFRLKNLNTKTAKAIDISLSILTDKTPTLGNPQHLLSIDNLTFSSTIRVKQAPPNQALDLELAPGLISPKLYFKRATSATAALGVYAGRLHVVVGSWTA